MKTTLVIGSLLFFISDNSIAGLFDDCRPGCSLKAICTEQEKNIHSPASQEASRLEAYLSEFSSNYDRFRNGSEYSHQQMQNYIEVADEIIRTLTSEPDIFRFFSLSQITDFFQRVTLDSDRIDALEALWLKLEPVFNKFIEHKLGNRHTWQTPSDRVSWKLGLQSANDLLYLIQVRRQFIGGLKNSRLRSFRSTESQIIREIRLGIRLNWMRNPGLVHDFMSTACHRSAKTNEALSYPFEPVYGRYGISGEILRQEYKTLASHSLFEADENHSDRKEKD